MIRDHRRCIVMSPLTESIRKRSNDTALIRIILKWHFLL